MTNIYLFENQRSEMVLRPAMVNHPQGGLKGHLALYRVKLILMAPK